MILFSNYNLFYKMYAIYVALLYPRGRRQLREKTLLVLNVFFILASLYQYFLIYYDLSPLSHSQC